MSFSFGRVSFLCFCLALAACAKPAPEKLWTQFSGEKALGHVQKVVDFGPRAAGSAAIETARDYIKEQLKSFGWKTTEQPFADQTPHGEVRFVNLIANFGNSSKPSFLLCSHYDTKIFDNF